MTRVIGWRFGGKTFQAKGMPSTKARRWAPARSAEEQKGASVALAERHGSGLGNEVEGAIRAQLAQS